MPETHVTIYKATTSSMRLTMIGFCYNNHLPDHSHKIGNHIASGGWSFSGMQPVDILSPVRVCETTHGNECFLAAVDVSSSFVRLCVPRRPSWQQFVHPRKYYHENPLDTRGRAKRAPAVLLRRGRIAQRFALIAKPDVE